MKRTVVFTALAFTLLSGTAIASEVTYREHIQPLFARNCAGCHGGAAPEHKEWKLDKEGWQAKGFGPKMDSYTNLIYFTGWPDTGALMRRLDDAKPGNMYQHLGSTEAERQENLALFKAWVGTWTTKRFKDLNMEELAGIKVAY
jgi:mono/diheme cytochrome c family protein